MANKLLLALSGGMNRKTSPLIVRDEECELLINYHLDQIGALTKREGYSTFASQPAAGKTVNGLYQFNDMSGGTSEQLMVANNAADTQGVIYYNNSGTWAVGKSNDTASRKSRFISFIDFVFRVNGANVVASSSNGSTWGTTNAPATITPKYGAVFSDRVYVANGNSANRSRFWFSSLPNNGSITWDINNSWVDVNPDDGDEITGLENNGNRLLIFKNRALYRWAFGQVEPDRLIGVGTSSQESIKTNLDVGITFFANPNGVYAYAGGRPKLLSRKIQDIIDAVGNWSDVFAEIDEDHYYLSVGDIVLEGRPHNNVVLSYHISIDAWSMYTFATPVKFMARLIESAPIEFIAFGSTDGRTYELFNGTSDNGSVIACEFRSKEYLLSFPNMIEISRVDTFAQNRGTTQILIDNDRRGNPYVIGNLSGRVTPLRTPNPRKCNSVRLYANDNSNNTCVIEGFNIEYSETARTEPAVKQTRKHGTRT